ncbi:ATP-binding cassette domain-containing protein [Nocardioides insulae]|uniref:ATP-binding cassette domain-containing protein n=1 Tax=Nocardioides insulae TaxID=394734 RepID=UPI00048D22CE|nr:ATP-binding cassette domain-containing protein [Nocardioides insulae]
MTVNPRERLLAVHDLHIVYPGRRRLLRKAPDNHAVAGVTFSVAEGETFGLVGESGSGKSTIGRAILGLTSVAAGSITFRGRPLPRDRHGLQGYRRSVQAVFQDPLSSLNPSMPVGGAIAEPLRRLRELSDRREIEREICALLEAVGLPAETRHRYPSQLSGGQRQRVAIARALAPRPELIVCDEAVSALDVSTQAQIVNLFADLQAELGVAYLFIAHDLGVVRHLSHRTGVLSRGEMVEQGKAREVHDQPQHPYTQQLLAAVPIPDPVRQAERRIARRAANAAPVSG